MSKRTYYERTCRVCKGHGLIGSTGGLGLRAVYIDEECPTCKGRGYQKVRMPRRKK